MTHRKDLDLIASLVPEGARVLDIGCGEGDLLALLRDTRRVEGRGLEISRKGVSSCIARGLSVVQGDGDRDLHDYPNDAFDYIILTRTIQAMHSPAHVLNNALRVGRKVIVSFPNFGFWRHRLQILLEGRMPQSPSLPDTWYDTPNIHFCTLRDFVDLCARDKHKLEQVFSVLANGRSRLVTPSGFAMSLANWQAREAVVVISRGS